MRLFKFWFEGRRDWWSRPGPEPTLLTELSQEFALIIQQFSHENGIAKWRLAVFQPQGQSDIGMDHREGDMIDAGDAAALIRADWAGAISFKMRESGCRFVMTGQDPILYICMRHDDVFEPSDFRQAFGDLRIADISPQLIETDIFDN